MTYREHNFVLRKSTIKNITSIKNENKEIAYSYIKKETLINAESNDLNIDFYHILEAYQAIIDWEYGKKIKNSLNQNEFINKFKDYTKVIWDETTAAFPKNRTVIKSYLLILRSNYRSFCARNKV